MRVKLTDMTFSARLSVRRDVAAGNQRTFLVLREGIALLPEDIIPTGIELAEATAEERDALERAGFEDLLRNTL